jgi:hypothetical protein
VSIRFVSTRFVEYTFMNSIRFMSICLVSIRFVSIRFVSIRFVEYTNRDYTNREYTFCKCIDSLLLCNVSFGKSHSKSPPDGINSRIPYSEGYLPPKHNFLKFKHENVIKMKNKRDPALSYLSNKIKKRVPKSHETIPLTGGHC